MEDTGIDGSIILRLVYRISGLGIDWIDVVQCGIGVVHF
jgi:hypothetical protein